MMGVPSEHAAHYHHQGMHRAAAHGPGRVGGGGGAVGVIGSRLGGAHAAAAAVGGGGKRFL